MGHFPFDESGGIVIVFHHHTRTNGAEIRPGYFRIGNAQETQVDVIKPFLRPGFDVGDVPIKVTVAGTAFTFTRAAQIKNHVGNGGIHAISVDLLPGAGDDRGFGERIAGNPNAQRF